MGRHFQKGSHCLFCNFYICSIAVGMIIKIIVMYPIQHNEYRIGIDNSLVLLIGGIPIVVLIALSATMAIDSPPQRKRRRATSERLKVKNQATEANGSPSA